MFDGISDTRLQSMLRRHISTFHMREHKLKNLRLCGSQAIRQIGALPAVFVVANEAESRFFGLNKCHSIWSCPHCTPQVMANKGREIASAIDALQKWYNQVAFMVTFTLPHTKSMTCKETFEILAETWRLFSKVGVDQQKIGRHRKKDGTVSVYYKQKPPFARFRSELNIKHYIRLYEFTHGENSWHPHIHALLWVPRHKIYDVVGYEDQLVEQWWNSAKHAAVKVLNKLRPHADNKAFVENFYTDWRKKSTNNGGHKPVFISKDHNGNARIQQSSYYVSGWSGDKEMTSNMKKARPGHRTPFQILEDAYKTTDAAERERLLELFCEYATTVHKRTRTFWSARSGIKDIIRRWEQTTDFILSVKKKFTDKAIAHGRLKLVCWFKVEQWSSICEIELTTNADIKAKILALARLPDGKKRIESLLFENDIDITRNGKHHLHDFIENEIINANVTVAA